AVAAWLVWRQGGWSARRSALVIYLVQLLFNAAWSPVFFGLQRPGLALVVILALLAAIVATLRAFHPVSRTAAFLLLPYLLWVNFATVLNLTLWLMNR
ncbi:MAG: tryptophan-rich sensory protein, partial [Akkermansiaceae bacterium]|nr:tryptophan-rich sensory protein [Akkermansiaceae bacterium]